MQEFMGKVAADFSRLLRLRLEFGAFTTEDSIRYTFFAALLRNSFPPERVVLEYRHPIIAGKEIDTVLLGNEGTLDTAIEFKYDRGNPGGTNQPLPQKAGAAFHDMVRLLKLPSPANRYFVYVTDDELARYLASPRNGLSAIFGLGAGQVIQVNSDFFSPLSKTFRNKMGGWPVSTRIVAIASEELPRHHHLRLLAVDPIS